MTDHCRMRHMSEALNIYTSPSPAGGLRIHKGRTSPPASHVLINVGILPPPSAAESGSSYRRGMSRQNKTRSMVTRYLYLLRPATGIPPGGGRGSLHLGSPQQNKHRSHMWQIFISPGGPGIAIERV